jgi:hypothetical protein
MGQRLPQLMRQFLARYWGWIAVLVAAIAYYPRFIKEPAGMMQFPAGAQCLLDQIPLQQCDATFTYPPLFAFAMIPFAPLSMPWRDLLWYAVSLLALLVIFVLSDKLARRAVASSWSERELFWLRLLTFFLSLKFVLAVLANQSYDAIVFLFVVCGISFLVSGRDALAGVAFAIGAALKTTPLLFLAYLLFKRRYLAFVVGIVVFLAASFLPDLFFTPTGTTHGYFEAWLLQVAGPALAEKMSGNPHTFWFATNPNNYSLRGIVGMFVNEYNNAVQFRPIMYPVYAAYVAIVAGMLWMTRERDDLIAVDGALLAISMLMLSPMTSRSHLVALTLPYAVLCAFCLKDRVYGRFGALVLGASFLLATASSNDAVGTAMSRFSGEYRLLSFGILLLLVYFGVIIGSMVRRRSSIALVHDAALG